MTPLMMDKQKFKEVVFTVSNQTKFTPWAVEKDYHLTAILSKIQTFLAGQMPLKGGGALNKIYLNNCRLSYDLDFVFYTREDLDIRSIRVQSIAFIRERLKEALHLKGDDVLGKELMGARVYILYIRYLSCVTGKEESIKVEVNLRKAPLKGMKYHSIKELYYDPVSGRNLIPSDKVLSVSLVQVVSEKLYAALKLGRPLTNRARDYYDLWHILQSGFNFYDIGFIEAFKEEIFNYGHYGNYRENFGLRKREIDRLNKYGKQFLSPFIRNDEDFDFKKVCIEFNVILSDQRFDWMRKNETFLLYKKVITVTRDYLNL